MLIKGYATKEGTSSYFEAKHMPTYVIQENELFNNFSIALGTHLGSRTDDDSKLYREAIGYALKHGINFIDTAINYRGMKSERDIGATLYKLIKNKEVERCQLVVSTKGGILPGDIDAGVRPDVYLQQVLLKPGVINEADVNVVTTDSQYGPHHHRHTLHPSYFKFIIEESKKNLRLETIDIYYLHNPGTSIIVLGKNIFYQKLKTLFNFYEKQVKNGNIRSYGIASWDEFLVDEDHEEHLSLERCIKIAEEVAGSNHHFRFIQLPYNIKRREASEKKNQRVGGNCYSILDAAQRLSINVTISSPLNQGDIQDQHLKPKDYLSYLLGNKKVYSVMVGMKTTKHVCDNIESVNDILNK